MSNFLLLSYMYTHKNPAKRRLQLSDNTCDFSLIAKIIKREMRARWRQKRRKIPIFIIHSCDVASLTSVVEHGEIIIKRVRAGEK